MTHFRNVAVVISLLACKDADTTRVHRPAGDSCTKNWQCIGFDCRDGECMRSRLGAECRSVGQCALGLECDLEHATCKAPIGGDCRDSFDCSTGFCTSTHTCAPAAHE